MPPTSGLEAGFPTVFPGRFNSIPNLPPGLHAVEMQACRNRIMQIVIAGDPIDYGRLIQGWLREQGCTVADTGVVSLEQALSGVLELAPEVVVFLLAPHLEPALARLTELRSLTRARLLAVGPACDPALILQTLRAGADDYLDEDNLESELGAALKRCSGQSVPIESGKLIAVLGASGGCGASTLAANLACALTQDKQRTLLIDLKLENGVLAELLDLKPTHTLGDLCHHLENLDRSLLEHSLAQHSCGVRLLASPRRNASAVDRLTAATTFAPPKLTPAALHQVLVLGCAVFPWAVLDVNPSLHEEQVEALRQANLVLLVLRLDFLALKNARRLLEQLDLVGIERRQVRLIANRTGQPKEVPAREAEDALRCKLFQQLPEDCAALNRAVNHGIPVVLGEPRARVARSYLQLAQQVRQEIAALVPAGS